MTPTKIEAVKAENGYSATLDGEKTVVAENVTKLARVIASFVGGVAVPRLRKSRGPNKKKKEEVAA